jgi:hypothetical protein
MYPTAVEAFGARLATEFGRFMGFNSISLEKWRAMNMRWFRQCFGKMDSYPSCETCLLKVVDQDLGGLL